MAEVVRKEPPVLIENVSLVINVFNIGSNQYGDLTDFPIANHPCGQQPLGLLQQNGIIQTSTTTASSDSRSTEASISLLQKSLNGPDLNVKEQFPLGWIALLNGDVIPFGVQPTALEIPSFGDRKVWKEIKVCLPPSLFVDNETDLYCPVASCREKLPRNKSVDTHIKKHLGFSDKACQMSGNSSDANGSLPCPLVYYCQDKKCQYYVETAEKSFKAYKNVKQHYQKVHAPRLFECDQCQKTFSTHKVLATHKLMCGELYSCSTCNLSYDTIESLQTHCRRKNHAYDHNKYKDKRNSVKQELQSQKSNPAAPSPASNTSTGRKPKTARKLPTILPKGTVPASAEVFNTIQAFCQRAGVKVDLGCQTVCTGFIHKSDPVQAIIPPDTPSFTQKKRKSTDTQTNIVKFRATCVDQKNNATNTNFDWKKVITSDSQTQTADSCDTSELIVSKPAPDSSVQFNDEFATFKISESTSSEAKPTNVAATSIINAIPIDAVKQEVEQINTTASQNLEEGICSQLADAAFNSKPTTTTSSSSSIKVDNGPSLHPEFISFLEATDSATQTDPEMFDALGSGECLGIRALFGDDLAGTEDAYYVSVSSTASQTAVESVATKSLSAEDYEALLNTTDDKKIKDLNAFSEYIKSAEGGNSASQSESSMEGGGSGPAPPPQGSSDFLYDWEHIVEEVYRDVGD